MFFQSVSLGSSAATPATNGPGIVLAEPGPPLRKDDVFFYTVHGSCRVPALDIEVERTEVLRGVVLTIVFPPAQSPMTGALVGTKVIFADDVSDVGADLVGSFSCEIPLPATVSAAYLHAAYRGHVSNVVRLAPPPGAP